MSTPAATATPGGAARLLTHAKEFIHHVLRTCMKAELDVQASQMAFNTVFSLGPMLALSASLLSLLHTPEVVQRIEQVIFPYVPIAVVPLLQRQLESPITGPNPLVVAASVIALFWTLSSAAVAITTALGFIGYPQSGSWFKRRWHAFVIGLVVVLGLTASALAAIVGPLALELLSRLLRMPIPKLNVIASLRWPIAGVVYGLGCALLVRYGTHARPRWRACGYAALVTALVATGASALLRVFFAYSPSLGAAMGTAGAVFAALLWLYVLSIGFLLGAVVAFVLEERAGELPSHEGALESPPTPEAG